MSDIVITGKVIGDEKVKRMFNAMPAIFRTEYLKWLGFEITHFIGSRKQNGAIRNYLEKQKRWSDKKSWASKVIGLFKGVVIDPLTGRLVSQKSIGSVMGSGTGAMSTGISMTARMGMLAKNKKQIHRAMEFLEEGGEISSSKYMPVPVSGMGISKPYQKFQHWLKSGQFFVVYRGGKAFYFFKKKKGELEVGGKIGKLMFVGYRRTNIKFHIRFNESWKNRQPGVEMRGQAATNRAVAEAEQWGK